MAYLKLVGSLAFFTTAFTLAGGAAALDAGGNQWGGILSGGAIGVFFGLSFDGGIHGRLLDMIYPPNTRGPDPTGHHHPHDRRWS
jgi:hypothetical protein